MVNIKERGRWCTYRSLNEQYLILLHLNYLLQDFGLALIIFRMVVEKVTVHLVEYFILIIALGVKIWRIIKLVESGVISMSILQEHAIFLV